MTSAPVIRASIAALALLCGACCDREKTAQRELPQPTEAEVRNALVTLAVHAKLAPRDLAAVERWTGSQTAEEAARIVLADESKFGESRRIRAIALLAMAGLRPPRFREALDILKAPIDELAKATSGAHDDTEIEQIVFQEMGFSTAIADCPSRKNFQTTPSNDWNGATIRVGLDLKRSLDDHCPSLDPQSWDICAPTNFKEACAAEETTAGWVCQSPGHPVGCAWDGDLLENFEINPAVSFRNVLTIDGFRSLTMARFGYKLKEGLESTTGPIRYDDGHVKAEPFDQNGEAWVKLTATKNLEFEDATMNLWAKAMLWAIGPAFYEGACCSVAKDPCATAAPPPLP